MKYPLTIVLSNLTKTAILNALSLVENPLIYSLNRVCSISDKKILKKTIIHTVLLLWIPKHK